MVGYYLRGLVLAVIAGVIVGAVTSGTAGHVQDGWVILAVPGLFALVLVAAALRRLRTTYTITSQRLTIEHGVLARDLHETRLERVQNVNSRQTLFERLLRVGTVDFDTAGSAEFNFTFRGVSHPQQIVRTVHRALRELRVPSQP